MFIVVLPSVVVAGGIAQGVRDAKSNFGQICKIRNCLIKDLKTNRAQNRSLKRFASSKISKSAIRSVIMGFLLVVIKHEHWNIHHSSFSKV